MTRGAYHPSTTPDGDIRRKDDTDDGRFLKRKQRDTPYYVRLNFRTFSLLESLLDVQKNRKAGTAITGCSSRADLIEAGFDVFRRINAFACEVSVRDTDLLITLMIEALRSQSCNTATPISLVVKPPIALPAPRNSNS